GGAGRVPCRAGREQAPRRHRARGEGGQQQRTPGARRRGHCVGGQQDGAPGGRGCAAGLSGRGCACEGEHAAAWRAGVGSLGQNRSVEGGAGSCAPVRGVGG
ncbi:hypothetical protein BS78_04G120000, partial [Paspalum vaginatum]